MSMADKTDRYTIAKAWVIAYVHENPDASVALIAKAANNARMTLSPNLITAIRQEALKSKPPFNAPRLTMAPVQSVVPTVRPAPRPPAMAVPPSPTPAPAPAPYEKVVAEVTAPAVERETRERRVHGKERRIISSHDLADGTGNVVLVLECGHACVRLKSAAGKEMALCARCRKSENTEHEIRTALVPLLRKFGSDMVLDVMGKLERQPAPKAPEDDA